MSDWLSFEQKNLGKKNSTVVLIVKCKRNDRRFWRHKRRACEAVGMSLQTMWCLVLEQLCSQHVYSGKKKMVYHLTSKQCHAVSLAATVHPVEFILKNDVKSNCYWKIIFNMTYIYHI